MKRLLFLFGAILIMACSFAQPYTFTSLNTASPAMNWSDENTWIISGGTPGYSYPQTTDDIVVINGAVLLNVDNQAVQSITVNNNTTTLFGSLDIQNNTISTSGNFTLSGFNVAFGTVDISEGELNIGGSFIFNNGGLNISGATMNVGEYYRHAAGTITASATVLINVTTNGPRNDDSKESIYYGPNAVVTLNTSNVTMFLQDLNLGSAAEIYANNFTLNGTGGTVTVDIRNTSNVSEDTCRIITDASVETLDLDINNENATGNIILCGRINDGPPFVIEDLILSDGPMITAPTTHLSITNSLNINDNAELAVNGNFTSTATNDLTVDGLLTSTQTLTIASDIDGNGTVDAETYSTGNNTVFGLTLTADDNGRSKSSRTWKGETSTNWFDSNNWEGNKAPPTTSQDVSIDPKTPINMPEIGVNGGGNAAESKNLTLGKGSSLNLTSGSLNSNGTIKLDGDELTEMTVMTIETLFAKKIEAKKEGRLSLEGTAENKITVTCNGDFKADKGDIFVTNATVTVDKKVEIKKEGSITLSATDFTVEGSKSDGIKMEEGGLFEATNGSNVQVNDNKIEIKNKKGEAGTITINGSTLTLDGEVKLNDQAIFNVDNGGTVEVSEEVELKSGSQLNVNNGSFNIGQQNKK